jgi:hypothetical protein
MWCSSAATGRGIKVSGTTGSVCDRMQRQSMSFQVLLLGIYQDLGVRNPFLNISSYTIYVFLQAIGTSPRPDLRYAFEMSLIFHENKPPGFPWNDLMVSIADKQSGDTLHLMV